MACCLMAQSDLPEPLLIYHQQGSVALIWDQFHRKCAIFKFVKWFEKYTCICTATSLRGQSDKLPVSLCRMSDVPLAFPCGISTWLVFNTTCGPTVPPSWLNPSSLPCCMTHLWRLCSAIPRPNPPTNAHDSSGMQSSCLCVTSLSVKHWQCNDETPLCSILYFLSFSW